MDELRYVKVPVSSVGFSGTQEGMTLDQGLVVWEYIDLLKPMVVNHGDCIGADQQFAGMCKVTRDVLLPGLAIISWPSNREDKRGHFPHSNMVHEPEDPLERNKKIVLASSFMIFGPNSILEKQRSGTWSTVRFARKKKRPFIIIYPDGGEKREGFDTFDFEEAQ